MTHSINTARRFPATTAAFLTTLALLFPASGQQENQPAETGTNSGTLYFINGDRLSGSLDKISGDGTRYHWKIAHADELVEINRDKIAAIDFDASAPSQTNTTNAVVNLTNGDEIFAELGRLHDQGLELSTTFARQLSLNRQMVGNLEMMEKGVQILTNLDSLDDWKNVPNNWSLKNGSIIADSTGQIAYDIGDAERLKISFDLTTSSSTYSVGIHAFADNPSSPDSGTNYSVRMGNRWLQASKTQIIEKKGMFRDDGRDTITLGKTNDSPDLRSLASTPFDFYFDRASGKVAVYMNNEPIGTWNDPGEFINPGTFISISTSSRKRVMFDNFSVLRWNGILPSSSKSSLSKKENTEGTTVSLANGDTLNGIVKSISEDSLHLETTDFGELHIATGRVIQLDLTTPELWDQARRLPMDVVATFRDGTKITFALTGFSNGIATLHSENFGTLQTSLDGLDSLKLLHLTENSADPNTQSEFRFLTPQEALGNYW